MPGAVTDIFIATGAAAPMQPVASVRAVPGRGLEGDRYYAGTGTFSDHPQTPDSEVTLIESEAVDAFNREQGARVAAGDARRNVVTRGIRLNDLVGREFTIGAVRLRGLDRCEPCRHLQRLTDQRVLRGLASRGGLRAQILTGGTLAVGDPIDGASSDVPERTA